MKTMEQQLGEALAENHKLKFALKAQMPQVVECLNSIFGKNDSIEAYIASNEVVSKAKDRVIEDAGMFIFVLLKKYNKDYTAAEEWLKVNCPKYFKHNGNLIKGGF